MVLCRRCVCLFDSLRVRRRPSRARGSNGTKAIGSAEAETAIRATRQRPLSGVHGVPVQQRGHHHTGRIVHDSRYVISVCVCFLLAVCDVFVFKHSIYNLMIERYYGRFVGGISVFTINLPSQHISCYQSFEIKQH